MYMLQEMLISLFKAAGFTCDDYRLHERQIENRRQQVVMHRRWVQAIFTYKPETVDSPQAGGPPPMMNPSQAGVRTSAVGLPVAGGDTPAVAHPQARGAPLQAQASAQPIPPPAHMEEVSQLSASPTVAQLAGHQPSPHNSSNRNQQHCTTSGDQALLSVQQAAATDHRPAWQQISAASQHQQSLSRDEAMLPTASQLLQPGCHAQPLDEQQGASSHETLADASDLSSTSGEGQQEPASVCDVSSTVVAAAPGLEAQQEAGVASAHSSATQRQEWEEGGTCLDQEPITGCLFADSSLEEVLLGSCLAVCACATSGCCCAFADHNMADNLVGISRTGCSETHHFSCLHPAQHDAMGLLQCLWLCSFALYGIPTEALPVCRSLARHKSLAAFLSKPALSCMASIKT